MEKSDYAKKIIEDKTPFFEVVEKIEYDIIYEIIKHCNFNYSKTSEVLKMNRTTLMMRLYKMRQAGYKLKDEQPSKGV